MQSTNSAAGFVATSSICQGQSVALFWKQLRSKGVEIAFAHHPFKWRNNAKNNAAVSCIIVGLTPKSKAPKFLYDDVNRKRVNNISAYLTENEDVYVEKLMTPPDGRPELVLGNQAIDGGHLILSGDERDKLLIANPEIEAFLRPLLGNNDFFQGGRRYCIWVHDRDYPKANSIPRLAERFRRVAEYRRTGGEVARSLVHIPYRFRYVHEAKDSILLIPRYTTERRLYLPVGMLDASVIVTDTVQVTYDPETFWSSILSSKLHVTWMSAIAGRLKTDPRYSNTLVYNTFPVPPLDAPQKVTLEGHAWSIISARESYPGKTIDWLYDPDTMPQSLLEAHTALDDTLEKIYIGRVFKNDTERLEHLFKLYGR
jgi:hypothetical protein